MSAMYLSKTPLKKPTRLYIKQSPNGLKYFGKHEGQNIETYPGSGRYWNRHLKKYKVKPNHLWNSDWYYYEEDITKFALRFSILNRIVESKGWANEKPENGLDGGWSHVNDNCHSVYETLSKEAKEKHSDGVSKGGRTSGNKFKEEGIGIFDKEKRASWIDKSIRNRKKTFSEIGHQKGDKNSGFGTMWIKNRELEANAKVPKDFILPPGWEKGRVIKWPTHRLM